MSNQVSSIRVEWQARIPRGYSAIAAEDKAGYKKGEVVSSVNYKPEVFVDRLCVISKISTNDSI